MADEPAVPGGEALNDSGQALNTQMTNLVKSLLDNNTKMARDLGLENDAIKKLNEPLTKFMKNLMKIGDNAEALKKALLDVNKNLNNTGADLEATGKALGKLASDLKKDHSRGGQVEKVRAAAAELKKFKDQIENYQEEFLKKIVSGGLKETDKAAIIEALKIKTGPSGNVKKAFDDLEKMRLSAQQKWASGAEDALDQAKKYEEAILDILQAGNNVLASAETVLQQRKEAYQAEINQLKLEGKKISLRDRIRGWSDANGGKGYASEANDRIQKSELGQRSGAAGLTGQFFDGDGKFSKSKMAMYLADQAQSRGKFGLEAYKSTGRQFGMEGQGFGSIYSTYQGTSRDLAGIGMRTGMSDQGEQMRAFQGASGAIRAGGPNKYQEQLKATEEMIKASNSMGVSNERLSTVLGSIRMNLGGSSHSITGYLGDMKDTLTSINKDVSEDMKVSSEEITGIYEDLAKDIQNAGMNMKTFSQYTKESQAWARQLSVPLSRALEMGKQLADLKSGKSASAYGTGVMAAAAGNLSQMRVGASSKSQLSGKTLELSQSGSQDEFIASLQQDIGKSNLSKDSKEELKKYVEQPDVAEWVSAAQSGDWAMYLTSPDANTKFMQISRRLKDLGAGSLLGIDFDSANKAFANSLLNIGGKGVQGRKLRSSVFGVNSEQQRVLEKDLNDMASGKSSAPVAPGQGREVGLNAISDESKTMRNLQIAADPMAAFKNAVEAFTGSVNSFGVMLAAQGALELANKTGMSSKILSWGKGLLPGGGAAAAEGGAASGLSTAGLTAGAATVGAGAAAAGGLYMAYNQTSKAMNEGSSYSSQDSIDKAWQQGNYVDWWARNGTKDIEDIGGWVGDKASGAWDWAFGNSQSAQGAPGKQKTGVSPNGDIHIVIPASANAQSLVNGAKNQQVGKQ